MKILITGYFGGDEGPYGNFGDEATLSSIITNIKKREKSTKFTVLSYNPKKTMKLHKINAVQIPILSRYWYKYDYRRLWKAIKDTDMLILGGGQSLQDQPAWETVGRHFIPTILAKLQNKKVAYLGIGASPLRRGFTKYLMKRVLKYVDVIITRDEESLNLVKAWGKKTNIKQSFDPVLIFNKKQIKKEKCVGLSARVYNLPKEKYAEISQFINWLIKKGYKIIFFEIEDDKIVFNEILKTIIHKDKVELLSNSKPINEIMNKAGKCQYLIGMRFHVLIAAFLNKTPFIGLNYDPKVERFCKFSNQPNIFMEKISFEKLKDSFGTLERNKITYVRNIEEKSGETTKSLNADFDLLFTSNKLKTNAFDKLILMHALSLIYTKLFMDLVYRLFSRHIFRRRFSF